jgi:hypothetical protein
MTNRKFKQVAISLIGGLLIIIGLLLSLPLVPGPGLLVIAAGLAILATEHDWAQGYLDKVKNELHKTKIRAHKKFKKSSNPDDRA